MTPSVLAKRRSVEIQLELKLRPGNRVHFGVRVGVVSDFVALCIFALQQAEVLIGVAANDEKRSRGVLGLEDVENLGSVLRVGAIVKAEGDFFVQRAQLLDAIGEGDAHIILVHDGIGRGIEAKRPLAFLRSGGDVPDVALAFEDEIVSGRHFGQAPARDIVRLGEVPDGPQGGIFRAHAPKSRAANPRALGSAQLVVGGDAVQHPDLVHVVMFVVVGIMRIERIRIVFDLGLGFRGGDDGLLERLRRRHLMRCAPLRIGPIVGVIGYTHDDFFARHELQHLFDVGDEPVLRGNGTGRGGQPVIVIVHQHDGIALARHRRVVIGPIRRRQRDH